MCALRQPNGKSKSNIKQHLLLRTAHFHQFRTLCSVHGTNTQLPDFIWHYCTYLSHCDGYKTMGIQELVTNCNERYMD